MAKQYIIEDQDGDGNAFFVGPLTEDELTGYVLSQLDEALDLGATSLTVYFSALRERAS